jgi:phosphoglycolate phosphatase
MARIVFDLDGTLVDSAPDLQGIANRLMALRGLAPITLDEARSFIGQGVAVFVAKLRRARGIGDSEQAQVLADFTAQYEDAVTLTLVYPDVAETLAQLRAEGHLLGLCTNKPMGPTLALLRYLDFERHFTKILAGDSLPQHKPDPAPLWAAFDMGGVGPDLYVGDSEVDAETARRAGVPLLLFTEGYRSTALADLPHRASFSGFSELPALVAGLVETA